MRIISATRIATPMPIIVVIAILLGGCGEGCVSEGDGPVGVLVDEDGGGSDVVELDGGVIVGAGGDDDALGLLLGRLGENEIVGVDEGRSGTSRDLILK
jgi:hypothetical protein